MAAVEHRVPLAWSVKLPSPPTVIRAGRGVLLAEQRDGGARELLAVSAGRPPVAQPLPAGPAASSIWGDVVVIGTDSGLVLLDPTKAIAPRFLRLPGQAGHVAVSPAGHRVYALVGTQLIVVDRFGLEILERTTLPGEARAFRVDPWGRLLLARPSSGDSVWVIDAGTNSYIATIRGEWSDDVPTVAPDGTLLTRQGRDLVALAADSLTPTGRVRGAETDRWLAVAWDPRRPALELADQATAPEPSDGAQIYVQVSHSLNEAWARDNATNLQRAGLDARVLPPEGPDDGYRVVLGPYPTREAAEAAGRKFGRSYWVFSRETSPPQ